LAGLIWAILRQYKSKDEIAAQLQADGAETSGSNDAASCYDLLIRSKKAISSSSKRGAFQSSDMELLLVRTITMSHVPLLRTCVSYAGKVGASGIPIGCLP